MNYLPLIFSIFLSLSAFSKTEKKENHNLVVIQKVSSDGTSFVIRRGLKDQVFENQKSLFSTKNISFVARAITVNREYSQWQAVDRQTIIPFQRGEIINLSYSVEKVWTEIPRVISDEQYRLTLQKEILRKDPSRAKTLKKKVRTNWQFLAGSSFALSESTQNAEDVSGTRTGLLFNSRYLRNYTKGLYYHFGLRYDSESYISTTPNITEETTRIMVYTGLTLRLRDIWEDSKLDPYIAFDVGVGRSSTAVEELSKSGLVSILPSARIGFEYRAFKNNTILLEGFAESITANETFADSGTEQKTTITNIGANLGLNF